MDFEIIANFNLSTNFSFGDLSFDDTSSLLTHEIIISFVCLFGVLANAFIIYILATTKKLHTPIYIYILNWAISDLFYLIITPCFYRIYAALESFLVTEEFFCVAIEMATILQIATIFFNGILCAIWFANIFFPCYGEYTKYILTIVWTVCFMLITVFSMFCIHDVFYLASHYLTFVGYTILLHLVIIMHLTKCYRKYKNIKPYDKSALITTLTTIYVICCLPSWLCILFLSLVKYLSVIAACISYVNSIVNVFVLYKFNRNFKTSFQKIFRCDTGGYIDATDSFEESEEFGNSDRSYITVTRDLQTVF